MRALLPCEGLADVGVCLTVEGVDGMGVWEMVCEVLEVWWDSCEQGYKPLTIPSSMHVIWGWHGEVLPPNSVPLVSDLQQCVISRLIQVSVRELQSV